MYRDWQWRAELGHVGQARHSGRMRRVAVHKAGGSQAICAGDRGGQPGHCMRRLPMGIIPKALSPPINFDVIKGVKQAVNMPLALHGGSDPETRTSGKQWKQESTR